MKLIDMDFASFSQSRKFFLAQLYIELTHLRSGVASGVQKVRGTLAWDPTKPRPISNRIKIDQKKNIEVLR